MFKPMAGQCSCHSVRYRMMATPMIVHCCHCRDCQRQTGSAFVINALVETRQIELDQGALEVIALPSPSGNGHDVHMCASCKTVVWSDYGRRPYLRFLRVSTLENAHNIRPDVHIYTRSKVPWVTLPSDVPTFEAYYEMEKVWSAESLRRRAAMQTQA